MYSSAISGMSRFNETNPYEKNGLKTLAGTSADDTLCICPTLDVNIN